MRAHNNLKRDSTMHLSSWTLFVNIEKWLTKNIPPVAAALLPFQSGERVYTSKSDVC